MKNNNGISQIIELFPCYEHCELHPEKETAFSIKKMGDKTPSCLNLKKPWMTPGVCYSGLERGGNVNPLLHAEILIRDQDFWFKPCSSCSLILGIGWCVSF